MYKSIYTKDYKLGIAIEIFRKGCKTISNVYKTGFHKWIDSGGIISYSVVIHRFRIIFWKPYNNKVKYESHPNNYMKEKDIKTIIPIVDPNNRKIIGYLNE